MKIRSMTVKTILWLEVAVIAIMVLGLPLILAVPRTARAADLSTCVSDSGASSVPSIHNACGLCGGASDTTRRGALWINNSSSKNSAIVNASSSASTVSFYLWGQVYACGNTTTSAMNAYSIWFAEAGHMRTSDPKVDFITVHSTSMSRGSTSGAFTWSGGGYITGTIDIAKFKANPNTICTDLGGGAQECTHTVSVNRCSTNIAYSNETGDQNPGTGCYGDDSVITLRLDGDETTPESSDAYVYSNSIITIAAQGDVSSHNKKTSNDGSTSVKFSTDQASVDVQFQHELHYVVANGGFDSADVFDDDVEVKYKIVNESNATVQSETTWKITKPSNPKSNQNLTAIKNETVHVDLVPGVPKQVCRRIVYHDKYFWFEITEDEDTTAHGIDHVKFHWGVERSSGEEDSVVCVTITRAKDPGGTGPYAGGSANSTIFFAGETGEIGWNVNAGGVDVRRLVGKQALVFNYRVDISQEGSTIGNPRYRGSEDDPCKHYTDKSAIRCSALPDDALTGDIATPEPTYASSAQFNNPRMVAIPDPVGWKYCNSYAYRFQYWYAYIEDGVTSWTHEISKDYWFVYNSACRTIAKKPAIAIWNGSVMSGGGVVTSLSPRFKSTSIMGKFADDSSLTSTRHLYGSWSEYLGVIGKSVTGLGSGAAFSIGGKYSISDSAFCDLHSNLTIANNNCSTLGYSGITANSAYLARISTYIKNQAEEQTSLDSLGVVSGNKITVSDKKIIHISGNLTIDKDIVLADGPYTSIYKLPRVIIFVDGEGGGNIDITKNVTRIDAWIFATGTINTCKEFVKGDAQDTQDDQEAQDTQAVTVKQYGIVVNSNSECSKQLVFNGPIYAAGLKLNRHYGSDYSAEGPTVGGGDGGGPSGNRYSAAEVFNYRADDYLWAYAQAGRYASSYTETYTRELPPRY